MRSHYEIPEMWYSIPGARECELAIRGDNNVTKKVGVILQSMMWNAIVALVPGQLPYNNHLVSRHRIIMSGNCRVGEICVIKL